MALLRSTTDADVDAILPPFRKLDFKRPSPSMISIRDSVNTARELSTLRGPESSPLPSSGYRANTPTKALHIPSSISTRVQCEKPLKVKQSSIGGAGRGLFVQAKAEEGEVIFSIQKPMLNILGSGAMTIISTCDNCMVSNIVWGDEQRNSPRSVLENPFGKFTFSPCSGCHVVYFCDEECRKQAWDHHHKFECFLLSTFDGLLKKEGDAVSAAFTTQSWDFRSLLRLLVLQTNEQFSPDDWEETCSLQRCFDVNEKSPCSLEQGYVLARVLKLATGSELSVEEILELIFAVHQNKVGIRHLVLKCANGIADATLPFFASDGVTVDPFLALVNHNCEPNATWVHNQGSIVIRALKEITPNTEITFSYLSLRGDCQSRKNELHALWGIDCHCNTCKKNTPILQGPLRDAILPLAGLDRLRYVGENDVELLASHRSTLEAAILDMKKAKLGDEVFPMRELYLQVLYCYMQQKDHAIALKTALKLYYVMDKKQIPSISPTDHLGMASVLVCAVNVLGEVDCKPLCNVMPLLFYHLKRQYLDGLEKWTGRDQEVFRQERLHFLEGLTKLAMSQRELGASLEIGKSRQARRAFATKMNKLMEWAGLPNLSEKDFI